MIKGKNNLLNLSTHLFKVPEDSDTEGKSGFHARLKRASLKIILTAS